MGADFRFGQEHCGGRFPGKITLSYSGGFLPRRGNRTQFLRAGNESSLVSFVKKGATAWALVSLPVEKEFGPCK